MGPAGSISPVPASRSVASSFTVGAWINPDGPTSGSGGGQITFWGTEGPNGAANGFRMAGPTGVNHYFWGNDHLVTGLPSLIDNTGGPNADGWNHVAVSYNGGTNNSTWYLNGAPIGTLNRPADPNVVAANFLIGKRPGGEFFDGLIDEVSIWNVPLDDATIAAGWNQPVRFGDPQVSPFLVAYWDFENGLADAAGGDNNGTFQVNAFIDAGANAPIPEPAAAILGVFGALLMLRRRR